MYIEVYVLSTFISNVLPIDTGYYKGAIRILKYRFEVLNSCMMTRFSRVGIQFFSHLQIDIAMLNLLFLVSGLSCSKNKTVALGR